MNMKKWYLNLKETRSGRRITDSLVMVEEGNIRESEIENENKTIFDVFKWVSRNFCNTKDELQRLNEKLTKLERLNEKLTNLELSVLEIKESKLSMEASLKLSIEELN